MEIRIICIITIWSPLLLLSSSCTQNAQPIKEENKIAPKDSLTTYQRYCYNRIESTMANDGGYIMSDSFKLFTFRTHRYFIGGSFISKTTDGADFVYTFWKMQQDKPVVCFETRTPKMDFVKDTILDINGDQSKDFAFFSNTRNGSCQPQLAEVYLSDSAQDGFIKINAFEQIPNPFFDVKHRRVTSVITCKYKTDKCIYQWEGNTLKQTDCKTKTVR